MEDKSKATKANDDFLKRQKRINDQWKKFSTTFGREAYEDLMAFANDTREMYMKYAEDRAMPNPNEPGKVLPLDNETVAALLQNSRGVNILRTYIVNRVNANDVAQSTATK